MSLDNKEKRKIALITGSTSRIGKFISKGLIDKGYRIIAHYNKTEDKIFKESFLDPIKADFNNIKEVEFLIEYIFKNYDKLDLFINNASLFLKTEEVEKIELSLLTRFFYINCITPLWLIIKLSPLLKRGEGVIINIMDNSCYRPWKGYSIYGATRSTLEYLTRALALELSPKIRVNGIVLGSYIFKEDFKEKKPSFLKSLPLRHNIELNEILSTIFYIIDTPSITGEIIKLDLGESLIR